MSLEDILAPNENDDSETRIVKTKVNELIGNPKATIEDFSDIMMALFESHRRPKQ